MSAETKAEPDALETKIIRQVEFYFGDRNLRRDKFLLEQVKKDDGWVPFTILMTFNRLKQLSADQDVVASALRKSTILEVSEDGSKLRRPLSSSLPDPLHKRSAEQQLQEQQRTVYAKGFPLDTTLDQLEEYFDQFGQFDIITMRRRKEAGADGKVTIIFKGSVFVEFKRESDAAKFVNEEELKYKDVPLLREHKNDYIKRKRIEETDRKKAQQGKEQSKKKEVEIKVQHPHGHILKFIGCGGNMDREKLKEFFTEYATVLWVEFSKGETKGYVRFREEDGAQRAVDGATKNAEGGRVLLGGGESELSVAEGEDEQNFYTRMEETKSAKLKQIKDGGKGRTRKRQRENFRNKPRGRQKRDQDQDKSSSPVKTETGDDINEGDDEDTVTKDDSAPSPKRAKQEHCDHSNGGDDKDGSMQAENQSAEDDDLKMIDSKQEVTQHDVNEQ